MEKETVKLIEALASKLGTTTEYLWSVLIRQAPIDATIDLVLIVLMAIFGIFLLKIHKWGLRKNKDGDVRYETDDAEILIVVNIIGALIFVIWFFISLFSINSIITGYFNPEYWALHQILHYIK